MAYVAVAVAFAWPLPLHLGTHLTGAPAGDTGVYVWNQWVFQHELLEHGGLPYFTEEIFSLTGSRANLSLHNYTTFQDALALPFIRTLGVVTTFNLIFLAMRVLTAFATFLLAKHVTGRVAESWLAGLFFAWSPFLLTRGMGHFSLVAAAPLAVFLVLLARAAERERRRDALLLGATVWWAASTDVYYAVYCLLIGAIFLASRVISVEPTQARDRALTIRWTVDVLLLSLVGLVIAMIATGGWDLALFGWRVGVHSLYTPMLVVTTLVVLRAGWYFRAFLKPVSHADLWRYTRTICRTGVVVTVLLSPLLYAFAVRIADGRFDAGSVLWRSSPSGADLLAFLVPNPNHPFAPALFTEWLTPRPDAYLENVVSIPLVGLALLVTAWTLGWRPPRWWAGLAVCFGLLALGPFIHIAGTNTYIPGPWAVLRYVPLIGMARAPGRFAVVMTLALAVLFALALTWLGHRSPRRRRLLLVTMGVLLAFELLPSPRPLYSAAVPRVYEQVARAPGDVRVLNLPFGVRDGTSSVGNFSARTQYFQTAHEKRLVGGYLSRVSKRRLTELRSNEILDTLILLSEGRSLTPGQQTRLIEQGPAFLERSRIEFIVIERDRAAQELVQLAISAFRLRLVESDGEFELYSSGSPVGPLDG